MHKKRLAMSIPALPDCPHNLPSQIVVVPCAVPVECGARHTTHIATHTANYNSLLRLTTCRFT